MGEREWEREGEGERGTAEREGGREGKGEGATRRKELSFFGLG